VKKFVKKRVCINSHNCIKLSPSQHTSASSPLNFKGMKFRGRCSLGNVFHLTEVVQNFHVKFSTTFQRSDNKLMVFCYFDIADTILYSS
jgi:hypothetical protein